MTVTGETGHTHSPPVTRRDALLPGGLLALGLCLVFHQDLFGGSDLLFRVVRDISPPISLYPWSQLAAESWRQGLFPLWNPYNFLGLPLAGNYQSSVFSPLMLPLYLPLEWVTVPWLLGRLWVAGMGAWWLGRRLGLGNRPATVSALAFGLTGYFTQHVAVQHLVIDLLLPFFLIAGHGLARRSRLRDFLAFGGLTLLALLGGQPGAALFTMAFGYGYALVAAWSETGQRSGRLLLIAGAGALASAVSSIQLLPFFEFIPQSWNFHLPGYGTAYIPPTGAVTAIAPGFWGALDRARKVLPLIKISPYYGLVPVALAGAGLLTPRRLVEKYFVAGLIVSTLILLGLPPLSWLVSLPGLDKLSYIKYLQPVVALCVAMLAGRGAQEVTEGRGRWKLWAAAKLLSGAVVVAAVMFYFRRPEHADFIIGATITACVYAFIAVAIAFLARRPGAGPRAALALAVLCLIELVLASSVNRTIYFRNVAREDWTPLRKALGCEDYDSCAAVAGEARYAASDDLLIPEQNLLVPYRELGAAEVMFVKDSYLLVREMTGKTEAEFVADYLKYHTFQVKLGDEISEERLAGMISLRGFLSIMPWHQPRLAPLLASADILSFSPAAVGPTHITIGNDTRMGIFAHAPSRIEFKTPIDKFAGGVDPRAATLPGEGVWFEALAPAGVRLYFARYLDPRRGDGGWIESAPQKISSLALSTLPAASSDNDWSVWGDHDLPVGSGWTGDRTGVRLRRWQTLTDNFASSLAEGKYPIALGGPFISQFGLQSWTFQRYIDWEQLPPPLLAFLPDAYFPGWKVFVDGVERKVVKTDDGLRGVEIKGDNRIEFLYQPWSFRIALWLCLVSLAATTAVEVSRKFPPPRL